MLNKLLIAVSFAFIANSAFADSFSDLDVDKDGTISKDEASVSETISKQWDLIDVNQDGGISAEEFSVLGEKK